MNAPRGPVHMRLLDEAFEHFRRVDQVLYEAALPHKKAVEMKLQSAARGGDRFPALVSAIVGQQLSTKAAAAIWSRMLVHYKEEITPDKVLRTRIPTLRKLGLSYAKAKTVRELARAILEKRLSLTSLSKMKEENAIESLTQVWGIGTWTAQMFLIFTLNRPDVFSSGDLGLRRSVEKLYELEANVPCEVLESYARHWSPYRSIACRLLWLVRDSE